MTSGLDDSGTEKLLAPDSFTIDAVGNKEDTSSRHGDDSSDDTFTDGDGGISEEDTVAVKVPLRTARRKSVMPPGLINNSDFLDPSDGPDQSPQNSITSINSISSLLKEKFALSFPGMLKKKRPQEYKLRAFVGILFLSIVFLVGFAYVFYHQQVLQRAYFERIRFNKEERVVRVFSNHGREILYGHLGVHLGGDRAFRCLPHDILDDVSVCMEWMHKARLYMNYTERVGVRCYHITWESLMWDFYPTDCYDWSDGRGHWYGGGQTNKMAWPIEKGSVAMSPFITGDIREHVWGNVLKRYFINSNGITVFVDPDTPLYVSVNSDHPHQFCLQARHDDFAYVYHSTPLPQLNYSICTSTNMKSLHSFFSEKKLWDGLKEEDLKIINSLLTEPVWQIPSDPGSELTEGAIYNYTEDVIALGFLRQGHVLLSEAWQPHVGDFILDPVRFPTMDETINIIHRRGFRIVFTIQPFVSTESVNFAEAVWKRLLVSERGTGGHVPALTRYKDVASAGMLDITNNITVPWLQARLKAVVDKYHIDAFYLDVGTAYDMPHYYRFENQLTNPDHYKTVFIDSILPAVGVVGVSSAIARPKAPVFVSLPPFASTWKSMQSIIPIVLTYGVLGYPFIMPGAVGGDYESEEEYVGATKNATVAENKASDNGGTNIHLPLPDKELYVRWLQLATFLPVIRYTHLPSKYGDDRVLEMAKVLTALRLKTVNPLLEKYVQDALKFGIPIIRPLWLLDPGDPICHLVMDEFSVGEELIVAPVLYPQTYEREVYLPTGVWKDGIDGSLRKGSRWLHNYGVPEDKVAHFIKMPDDTRF
ncbi:uncharacterized family 31 glucosidase KIAA1161 isoform X2 [Zootermopsis nevadensis]|uniref:uncharacterized family 31 glucosidase KIAA1161 isoform X2 n=1 Tax=Zootermopsis nevadensis TaxID=136037 RepID=UPI000B8EDF4A|nr:uncharacterized family 31 glucosidase KIAA1161 isoform X2 [Zootermopsis nevadensis]